jgi:cystathionine gamma-lyase
MKFTTRAIHVGQEADPATGAVIVPIHQTSTYAQTAVGEHKGYDYSRTNNPTRTALQRQLAALDDAAYCSAFASGMAAITTVMQLVSAGDHVLVCDDLYGGAYRLFTRVLPRYGVRFTFADMTDIQATHAAIEPSTKMIWVETPTNPLLKIVDIAAIAGLKRPDQTLVVDNTFASPYLQSPLALGADIALYSTTKYIAGHSDLIGGAAVTNDKDLAENITFHQNALGAVPGPMDAWLTMRGAKTLAVRMREHVHNAQAVAAFLAARDDIATVHYPGLAVHPQHALACKQMRGFGGMVSFIPRGPEARALEIVKRTQLFSLAESLGGVESLLCVPARMTQAAIPKEIRESRGITENLIRLSVGLEDAEDLIEDLRAALEATELKKSGMSRCRSGQDF